MVEEKSSLAYEEQPENLFDLNLHVYALPAEQQEMNASNPNGSSVSGCGRCLASMALPEE